MSLNISFSRNQTHFGLYPSIWGATAQGFFINGDIEISEARYNAPSTNLNLGGYSIAQSPALDFHLGFRVVVNPFRCHQLDNFSFPIDKISKVTGTISVSQVNFLHQSLSASIGTSLNGNTFSAIIEDTTPQKYYNVVYSEDYPATPSLSLLLFGIRNTSPGVVNLVPLGGGGLGVAEFTGTNNTGNNVSIPIDFTGFAKTYYQYKNDFPHFTYVLGPDNLINMLVSTITDTPEEVLRGIGSLYKSGNFTYEPVTHDDLTISNHLVGGVDLYTIQYSDIAIGPMQMQIAGELQLADDMVISTIPPSMRTIS